MPRSPHSSFRKGTPVHVRMKDKTSFDDHFEDRKGQFVVLREYGNLSLDGVKSIGIRKDRNASLPNRDPKAKVEDPSGP